MIRVSVASTSPGRPPSYLPQSLNDDLWHTVTYSRRGNKLHAAVDDEEPRRGEGEEKEEVEGEEKEREGTGG